MVKYWSDITDLLKGKLYDFVLILASLARKQKTTKKVLIVRVDEIGDYILWRKFLVELVLFYRNKNYEIHFIGNSSWKSIFLLLDNNHISQSFWVDKKTFKKNLWYRYKLLRTINSNGYEAVVNPIFSRDKRNDDAIVMATKALYTFGMKSNTESVRSFEKGYDNNLYTMLYTLPKKPVFEFYRNQLFTEFITQQASKNSNTGIQKELLPPNPIDLKEKYFVVFPGSRSVNRIWPTENFIAVSKYVQEQYGCIPVLCGAPADAIYTHAFAKNYPYTLVDMSGKTTLPEMLSILSSAACLLSIDTGAVHLAAAVGCKVFGVFNGSQYKRFAPYPNELSSNFFTVYPTQILAELENEQLVKAKYEFVVNIPYSSIEPDDVIQRIRDNL